VLSFELKKPNNIGLKCCFWGQFVTKGHDVDTLMADLVSYEMRPGDLSKSFAAPSSPETVMRIATSSTGWAKPIFCHRLTSGLPFFGQTGVLAAWRCLRRLFLRFFGGAPLVGGSEHVTEGASKRKVSHHSRGVRFSLLVSAPRRRYAMASANSGLLTREEGCCGGILCREC
jgi:hypothetical protein